MSASRKTKREDNTTGSRKVSKTEKKKIPQITLQDPEPGNIIGESDPPNIKVRDGGPRDLEKSGVLRFINLQNNNTPKNLALLLRLKHLITVQLPNMPPEYVTRLVFSYSHQSIVGMKKMDNDREELIGGITFTCFDKKPFTKYIEVVFLAVRTDQQVHGYGSRLMNQFKTWAQKYEFYHLLTYADNSAIQFFQRQGFTEDIGMKKNDWDNGFLKSYQDATLMYCSIHPKIDYLEISLHLRQQRLAYVEKIKSLTNNHIIYSGVKEFEKGLSPINIEKLQGLKKSGWDSTSFKELLSPVTQREIYIKNETLLETIKEEEEFWPFMAPVVELFPAEATRYSQVIKDPIDLRTIEEKLKSGFYITHEILLADLERMVLNCQKYNQNNPSFWELAEKINTRYLKNSITEGVGKEQ